MKVVLIHFNGVENISSRLMHAIISTAGFETYSIFFRELMSTAVEPTRDEVNTLVKKVTELKPDIVGMGVNSMRFADAVLITELVKKATNAKILWGGVQATLQPERALDYADFVCVGEGDEAVIELLKKLEAGEDSTKVKNIWQKQGEKIISNPIRDVIGNLDTLPFPDFTDKNKFFIIDAKVSETNPILTSMYFYSISTSRGCPYSCNYCINNHIHQLYKHKFLRKRSVENVIQELEIAKKLFPKLRMIVFCDDVFTMDVQWLTAFKSAYVSKIGIPFECFTHPSFVNDAVMKLLVEAGLTRIALGIQSGSERVRRIYQRYETNKTILEACKAIHKYGAPVSYDLIASEFENEEDILQSLELILALPKPFTIFSNKMTYYPEYPLTKIALEKGLIDKSRVVTYTQGRAWQPLVEEDLQKYMYINYFHLAGKRYIPNWLILRLYQNKFHEKHPKVLVLLCKVVRRIDDTGSKFKSLCTLLANLEFGFLISRLQLSIRPK